MKHEDNTRLPKHLRRRSRDGFRSHELLAALTVSAEAITLRAESGNPEEAAARASNRRNVRRLASSPSKTQAPTTIQNLVSVSNAKIMAMKKLKTLRKYGLGIQGSLMEEDDDDEEDAVSLPTKPGRTMSKSLAPIAAVALQKRLAKKTSSPSQSGPAVIPKEKHAIGKFETRDSNWKATIDGEVEKFMYPSLRLETLYPKEESTSFDAETDEMPSSVVIDEALTTTAKVNWELERLPPSPAPQIAIEELDSKRLQFDQKLADAEATLRKREIANLKLNTTASDAVDATLTRKASSLGGVGSAATALRNLHANRSLCVQPEVPQQQPIPRLPQTRKLIREIQRHPTNAGQIEYYADKHHLFTKWKKVEASQQHHQLTPLVQQHFRNETDDDMRLNGDPVSESSDDESDLEDASEAAASRAFGKLSPRSLFYHECVKNQILPEPIFSRINVIKAPTSQPPTARPAPSSFVAVASIMVEKVQQNSYDDRPGRHKRHLTLQLQQFGLGDAKIIALAKSLRQFQAIQVLDLGDNRLTDASIIPLLQSLAAGSSPLPVHQTPAATVSNAPSPDNRTAKAKLLAAVNRAANNAMGCKLTVLNLSKNELGREGCRQIALFLAKCSTLVHLDLSHTTLGGDDEALAPLASAIEAHPSLKHVNLAHNSIGERGGVLLGAMLTNSNCVVRVLDVSWNSIRRSGAVALGVAMRTNTALRTLHMSMNRCGDCGGEQLAAALACNTTLKQLDLSHNALTGASAVAFGFFLRDNHSLQTLDMKDNNLGEVGARALMRAIALGSRCEIKLSVHDLETSSAGSTSGGSTTPIFDASLPSASSPFELQMGESPYEFAVASELIEAALIKRRCTLSELSYEGNADTSGTGANTARKRSKSRAKSARARIILGVDKERRCLYNVADTSKTAWKLPTRGTFRASATFTPPPLPLGPVPWLTEEACLGLIHIVSRGFSTRDMINLLDLVLVDLQLTTTQATFFVAHLQASLPKLELLGRLWPCLIDGGNAFDFLQQHLTPSEQWRLVDRFGPVIVQFSTANPTGHWSLNLRDTRQRKLALWFASLNAYHAAVMARYHPKRTDCSQYGRGFNWRNVYFNQKPIQLTYAFFDRLPRDGVLEFDYVSPIRPEDRSLEVNGDTNCQDIAELDQTLVQSMQVPISDQELTMLLEQIGAEVCAIYVPVHKRQNLKYQLVLFHLAIAGRRVMIRQAHHILQHFPKNYESGRLRALIAMHHAIVDLECFGELLERLAATDRPRVYAHLGYLSTVTPLAVDMDFEVDFTRDDEKLLLRALVDLSISCPMDMIRIDSSRSTVLIIYSMYQTNTVPATGRICFRYVTHQNSNRIEWLRTRQQIYRHFLCGDRLRGLSDSAALALVANDNNSNSTSTGVSNTEGAASTV